MWSTTSDRERAEIAELERQRKAAIPDTGDRVLTLRIVYNPAQMERDSEFVQDRRIDRRPGESLDTHADIIIGDISALLESDRIAATITLVSDVEAR